MVHAMANVSSRSILSVMGNVKLGQILAAENASILMSGLVDNMAAYQRRFRALMGATFVPSALVMVSVPRGTGRVMESVSQSDSPVRESVQDLQILILNGNVLESAYHKTNHAMENVPVIPSWITVSGLVRTSA